MNRLTTSTAIPTKTLHILAPFLAGGFLELKRALAIDGGTTVGDGLGHGAKLSRPASPAKGLFWIILRHMIGLTDTQLEIVMGAARVLPVETRDTFLQRIAAMLALRGRGRFNDADVADVAKLALTGLAHQPVA
jgi:hypothetical protein